MQDLRVVGVESGALLVATDAGSEFRLPVTGSLQSQLRQADPDQTPVKHRVSPREIQASIRAGRTAEQVSADTGAEIGYVRRFEGPVLDERAFLLESARAVPVSVAGVGASESARFGAVIDSRLDEAEATARDWTSYKDAEGWIVHVSYTTSEVERDASWRFDPKKQGLAPLSGDAHTLSRQDADHSSLVPRLRAVSDSPASPAFPAGTAAPAGSSNPDDSGRFDSGAFEVQQEPAPAEPAPTSAHARAREGWSAASLAAMNRAPEAESAHNQTADLLDALRRRRGEREAARFGDDDPLAGARAAHPSTGGIRVIDVPLDDFDETLGGSADGAASSSGVTPEAEAPRVTKPLATHPTASRRPASAPADEPRASEPRPSESRVSEARKVPRARKGRASMPSWDEIVFGARSDDDPA
ncbi:DUF3071 family protein [Frondihabitans sp. PhB188]|uniref:septation protein SepH n=1 Tax=Frondihabitans sp. PhB188 TaxID=2485200 RepID=UPI000FB3286A|nr:septation protein SepH [Frondihabitans sp. PhB188]ROQ41110.1 DUF3071 family protein [Frondihabitans sp. PhB188]